MARPARALAFRSALVAVFTLFAGLHLSGRQTPVPDRQQPSPPAPHRSHRRTSSRRRQREARTGRRCLALRQRVGACGGRVHQSCGLWSSAPAGPAVPNRIIADARRPLRLSKSAEGAICLFSHRLRISPRHPWPTTSRAARARRSNWRKARSSSTRHSGCGRRRQSRARSRTKPANRSSAFRCVRCAAALPAADALDAVSHRDDR